MRVLVLSKRYYTGKDLLKDRYGRMWELPHYLAMQGHAVRGASLGYRRSSDKNLSLKGTGDLEWSFVNMRLPFGGLFHFWRIIDRMTREFRPQLIWAGSDLLHIGLGVRLARKWDVPVVVDMYDNFESFGATRFLPGGRNLLRRSIAQSAAVSCVSQPLATKLINDLGTRHRIEIVENGVDEQLFRPMDRTACRNHFKLPLDAVLVGTAGALFKNRGINIIGDACRLLREKGILVKAVFAGPRDAQFQAPSNEEGIDLGILPHQEIPILLNALDVVVVANLDSNFGRYCFPMKLYETLACHTPLVVANIGVAKSIFKNSPQCMYKAGDTQALATALEGQLESPSRNELTVPTWPLLGRKLENLFQEVLNR